MGKKSSKVIDKRVFYTNCFLCLFGVIPGVVAFILDYDSETIYYTEAELMPDDLFGVKRLKEMKRIPCSQMSCEEVARLLSKASGKSISPREVQIALERAGTHELLCGMQNDILKRKMLHPISSL